MSRPSPSHGTGSGVPSPAVTALMLVLGLIGCVALVAFAVRSSPSSASSASASALPRVNDNDVVGSVRALSWTEPRVFLYRHFLTQAECEYIIAKGLAKGLKRSTVVSGDSGAVSTARTSSGLFLSSDNDPVLQRIEERVAVFSHMPVENQEQFYLLEYQEGQKYDVHPDFFPPQDGFEKHIEAGQRKLTVLMYLSAPAAGGETFFPNAAAADLQVQPRQGDAVLFHSMNADGSMDWHSVHGSAPVRSGTKYALTKWVRVDKQGKEE
eukprot:TRINITY_DN2700_c0_g1_i2.p1 TRINITY_DN2700_c0_g1~~TRINITY_DN2700_c0_g1_i2.p1  ORF type:complete len:267 (-),score=111.63 TRINITY_DN2700_c0_g1_i2:135-935(-)